MLRRIRWFGAGLVAGVGGSFYVVARARRLRAALTPQNLARATALSVADVLEAGSRALIPPAARSRTPSRH